ncbi:putative bacteriocin export ABC transporter [Thomasclavelia spiroformis]|uniref:putative bacteriocin export ABC transporter n=1 Tax=Thomasclavelia spiroformis TaxID=29348 RepID=UPI0024300B7D|nr:putative bacteriocin export ABC transporter [Thomasclavelia spiroformis]
MIEIKNLNKKINDKVIFNNLNLTIEDGEMLAISGASGSGKTTLLNILGKLDKEYDGNIIIDNKNLKTITQTNYLRNTIGYLFQNYALADNLTVTRNLDFSLKYSDDKSLEAKENALEMVGLDPKEYLNKKIYTLSGGEQQRVALARLFLKPCSIILADEPTGSLDVKNRDIVLEILRKMNEHGKTVIVVTHDPYVLTVCDRVIKI